MTFGLDPDYKKWLDVIKITQMIEAAPSDI